MTSVLVGCPVQSREWILHYWFEFMEAACKEADVVPDYVFTGDPSSDPDTFRIIDSECLRLSRNRAVIGFDEPARPDERVWNPARYGHMAEIRNRILEFVRTVNPDFFWSVDSDILVSHATLTSALEKIKDYDALGSRCYLTPFHKWCANYGMMTGNGGIVRPDSEGCFKVDAIMAIKLMTPKAYNIDYQPHSQGEDIGWSKAARKAGCRLGWDGSTVSKHVMAPEFLREIDERCGY